MAVMLFSKRIETLPPLPSDLHPGQQSLSPLFQRLGSQLPSYWFSERKSSSPSRFRISSLKDINCFPGKGNYSVPRLHQVEMKITGPEGNVLKEEDKEEVIAISTDEDSDAEAYYGGDNGEPGEGGDDDEEEGVDDDDEDSVKGFNSSGGPAVHSVEDEDDIDENENVDEQGGDDDDEGVEDDDAEQALNSAGEPAVQLVQEDEAGEGDNDDEEVDDEEGEHVEKDSGSVRAIRRQEAEGDGSDYEPEENGEVEDDVAGGLVKRQRSSKDEIGDDDEERPPKR